MAVAIKKTISAVQTDISSLIDWASIEFNLVLTKEVSTLQFDIKLTPEKTPLVVGTQIDIYEDQGADLGVHIFGGTVTEIQTMVNTSAGIGLLQHVKCIDWSFSLNSKLVARNYTDQDPADILADIVSSFSPSGFDTSTYVVTAGFNIPSISFNYEQVTQSIEKLAKQIGWQWYVDADKNVHFFPPGEVYPSPFDINDTEGNLEWPTLNIDEDITNMKNSVVVIGGNYNLTTTPTTTPDIYKTDGVRATYQVVYPYSGDTIAVTLDGASQTIGLSENNPDPMSFDVIYDKTQQFITFTVTPTTGKTVNISGTAELPIIATSSNQTAIAIYGTIQDSIIDKTIKSQEEAQQRADTDIAMYSSPVYSARFYTISTGLMVGQTISISSALFNQDLAVVVNRITGRAYGPNRFRYRVECVGTDIVSFIDIMSTLLTAHNTLNPSPASSTVENVFVFIEDVTITETLMTPTTNQGPFVWAPSGGNIGLWNQATWN